VVGALNSDADDEAFADEDDEDEDDEDEDEEACVFLSVLYISSLSAVVRQNSKLEPN
jgi:hypothetical protein